MREREVSEETNRLSHFFGIGAVNIQLLSIFRSMVSNYGCMQWEKKVECMDINRKKKRKKKRIWGKNLVYSDNLGGNRIGFEVVKVWCGQQLLSWLYVWALLKGYVHLYSFAIIRRATVVSHMDWSGGSCIGI